MERGYIKLWRKIEDFDWYKNPVVLTLWIHILLNANHSNKPYQGLIIKRGTFKTGLKKLTYETGLSIQQVRTALDKLTITNNITSKITNKYRIITVLNYNDYQMNNKLDNKQSTNNQQTNNNQITTTNNDKHLKNEKNDNKVSKESKEDVYFDNTELDILFKDFLKQRKSPKVKNTQRAVSLLLNKLAPFNDEIKTEMINNSLVSGWTSLFPIKDNKFNNRGTVAKNKLPNDIESDWLDEYIEKTKES